MNKVKYRLVNNKEYDLKGVYFGGMNKKYHDMFNITTQEFAMVFDTREEAEEYQDILKRCFRYDDYEIEEFVEDES